MTPSFRSKLGFVVLCLAIASCGGDDTTTTDPSSSDDSDEGSADEDDAPPSKDAGGSKDAGARKDAAAPKDAGKSDQIDGAGDDPTGDTGGDPGGDPPTNPNMNGRDAGIRDAGGSTKPDAGHTADAGKPDAGGTTGSTCDTLTYASFGKTFLDTYCVSCHGGLLAQNNVHLDTLAGVKTNKSKVQREVSSSSMPPRGSKAPSAAERQQLTQWITCGPN